MLLLNIVILILVTNQGVVSVIKDESNYEVTNEIEDSKISENNENEHRNGINNELNYKIKVQNMFIEIKNEMKKDRNGKSNENKDKQYYNDIKTEKEMKENSENYVTVKNNINYEFTDEINETIKTGVTKVHRVVNKSHERFTRAVDDKNVTKKIFVPDFALTNISVVPPADMSCFFYKRSGPTRNILTCINGNIINFINEVEDYAYMDGALALVKCEQDRYSEYLTIMKYYEKQGDNLRKVFEIIGKPNYLYVEAYIKLQNDNGPFKIECQTQNPNNTRLTKILLKVKKDQSTPSFLVNGLRLPTRRGWSEYISYTNMQTVNYSEYFTYPGEPILLAMTKTDDYDGAECDLIKYPNAEFSRVIYKNNRLYFISHNFAVLCLLKNQGKIVPNKNITLYSVNGDDGYLPLLPNSEDYYESGHPYIENYKNTPILIYGLRWSKVLIKCWNKTVNYQTNNLNEDYGTHSSNYVRYLYEGSEVIILAFVTTFSRRAQMYYEEEAMTRKRISRQNHKGILSETYSFVLKAGYQSSVIRYSVKNYSYVVEFIRETRRPAEIELLKLSKGKFPDNAVVDSSDPENNILDQLCLDCGTSLKMSFLRIEKDENEDSYVTLTKLTTFLQNREQRSVKMIFKPGDTFFLTCETVTEDLLVWKDIKNGISSKKCGTTDKISLVLNNLYKSDDGSIIECKSTKNYVTTVLIMDNKHTSGNAVVTENVNGTSYGYTMVTFCNNQTAERLKNYYHILNNDSNTDLDEASENDSEQYLVIILSIVSFLGLLIIILTIIILVLRKRSSKVPADELSPDGDNLDFHIYEAVQYGTTVNQPMDISERPQLPIPPEALNENRPYIHYDTPYEFRIFRLGVNLPRPTPSRRNHAHNFEI